MGENGASRTSAEGQYKWWSDALLFLIKLHLPCVLLALIASTISKSVLWRFYHFSDIFSSFNVSVVVALLYAVVTTTLNASNVSMYETDASLCARV